MDSVLNTIEKLETRGAGARLKTRISIEEIFDLTDFYLKCSNEEREIIYQCFGEKTGLILIAYTGELAAKAIDENSKDLLVSALMLHVIEGFRYDPRENIRRLVFIYYASNRLKVTFKDIVEVVLPVCDATAENNLLAFCNRSPEMNQLTSFGMKEVKVKEKTRFVTM